MQINLPVGLTELHLRAVTHYLTNRHQLEANEWPQVWQAMDLLSHATVTTASGTVTFAQLYRHLVEDVYADQFISACYEFSNLESESAKLRATISRHIVDRLRQQGLYVQAVSGSQVLAAYMLYWWESFARGYAFEIEIYRDLAISGIVFTSHPLGSRFQRLSRHDLKVLGFQGDIKISSYFLHMRRRELTTADFYITRLYHRPTRRWEYVVLMQEAFWRRLNGDPTHAEALDKVWEIFPSAARLRLQSKAWVIVLYDWWKQRVRQCQVEENGHER